MMPSDSARTIWIRTKWDIYVTIAISAIVAAITSLLVIIALS